uniref:Nucleolar protein 8 n=1 Tax=Pongo abelii TaxID=9601 RepID=A0A8I5YJT6_PONAB
MKVNREMKRLYVDGLSQEISETVLQNQFSRFAEVSDVEIITWKDDQRNPQKVFAYINISVAEADLKKCISVLNKTKWKGRTLQIQLAKESFLSRCIMIWQIWMRRYQLRSRAIQERNGWKSLWVKHRGSCLIAVMTRNLILKMTVKGSKLNLSLRAELDRSSWIYSHTLALMTDSA